MAKHDLTGLSPIQIETACRQWSLTCTDADLDYYFLNKYPKYLDNPTAAMIISGRNFNSDMLVEYFFRKFLSPSQSIESINLTDVRVESLNPDNPQDAVVMYSYLEQPFYVDDELHKFLSRMDLGMLPENNFPIEKLFKIFLEYKIGSLLLLTNYFSYTFDLFDLEEIIPDADERRLTQVEAFEEYINKHRRDVRTIPQLDLEYLKSAKLYGHLHMLNKLLA